MRVGAYEILSKIGEGGTGSVFRARGPDGRELALKLLRHSDEDALARFERETRLLGSLGESEGYVPLLDRGRTREGAFLVMPFLAGGTLRDRLERGPLSVAETLDLGRTLARSLGAAHARGIVHRDVKPENVLFPAASSPAGKALLADLGLAKHFDASAKGASLSVALSVEGRILGTAGYMAPEQLQDARSVGPPADVHALACVIFECLTGTPAFIGDTPLELMTRIADGRRTPLERHAAPAWVIAAIERALAPSPRDRFPDGLAFARALAGEERRGRKRPLLLLAALALVTGLVLALALGRKDPEREALALVARGVGKDRARDRKGAIADFTLALERAPGLAIAWARRAEARGESNDHEGELADATRALELDARLALAWRCRGDARGNKGDPEGEIQDASRAIELDPADAKAWCSRSSGRGTKRDFVGAIADATRAIELAPKEPGAWIWRSYARFKTGDPEGARADADRAVEIAPGNATTWLNRSGFRELNGDLEGGIADATRAIELEPAEALHWARRAKLRGRKGDIEGKIVDETKAIEVDPRFASAWAERALARHEKGDLDGAIADETRAIELAPGQVDPWVARATHRYEKQDFEGAIADAARAIELAPGRPGGWLMRGVARDRIGDAAGALADLGRFLELAPDDPQAPGVRARIAKLREGR